MTKLHCLSAPRYATRHLIKQSFCALSVLLIVSCGGSSQFNGGGESESVRPPDSAVVHTGVFFDSAVGNLAYRTATQSGLTNARGEFRYLEGETIIFSIGEIVLPAVVAKSRVTPVDLFADGAIDHRGVVNVSRLLQSVDIDGNPDNGIDIAEAAHAIRSVGQTDFESVEFTAAINPLIESVALPATELVPAARAMRHLTNSLLAAGVPVEIDTRESVVLSDTNGDGVPDDFDWDDDGDGVSDDIDQFPYDPREQFDFDGDGIGNNADLDDDNDGVADTEDAFAHSALEHRDSDGDGIGDNADTDDDNDGTLDPMDLFPFDPSEQRDYDGDGIGDRADHDDDNDGVADSVDAFPFVISESRDTDNDGIGDNTDTDADNDGVNNSVDRFPYDSSEQFDFDNDGIGNNADDDDDNDGVIDALDTHAFTSSEQHDHDGDGIGDSADTDDDNDGVADTQDLFPRDSTEYADFDRDGIGNNADTDDDNDGFIDADDAFPFSPGEHSDHDSDGIGDNRDLDDDNDGVLDAVDAFPLDSSEYVDTDGDGIGDRADADDDGDGIADDIDDDTEQPINTAPDVVTPDSLQISYRIPVVAGVEVSDRENNAVRLSWTPINGPDNGDLTISLLEDPTTAILSATVTGIYTIGIRATDGIDFTDTTFPVEVVNHSPVIPPIAITPAEPDASVELVAYHEPVFDADDDTLELSYLWWINRTSQTEPVVTSEPYLPAGTVSRGDEVSVEVQASDGEMQSAAISPQVAIGNAAPSLQAIDILPQAAGTLDEISLSLSGLADADDDELVISYQWYLNGQLLPDQTQPTLPAGVAKYPDHLSAQISVSDGIDALTQHAAEIQLTDTPAYLDMSDVPQALAHSQLTTFSIAFVDPDGSDVSTSLADAPPGFAYDSDTATASWAPKIAMLGASETYYVNFRSSSGTEQSIALNVVDAERETVLARGGIAIPKIDISLDIGDFDQDGKSEILSTNGENSVFTLELRDDKIVEDWLYPHPVAIDWDIINLWSFGADGTEILVATEHAIFHISSRASQPVVVFESTAPFRDVELADVNADGNPEMVTLSETGQLLILSTDTWQLVHEYVLDTDYHYWDYALEIGNLDADPGLEIVLSSGEIIDGGSGLLQLLSSEPFGRYMAIGDINGDGSKHIFSRGDQGRLTQTDPVTGLEIASFDITGFCGLRMRNVDLDPQDEIIYGACQHGAVEVYDGSTGSMVLQAEYREHSWYSGRDAISFGDIDDDGIDELVFSTGGRSSGTDRMVVAALSDVTPASIITNTNPAQMYQFQLAGWDTSDSTSLAAIYTAPDGESAVSGRRLVRISEQGELETGAETDGRSGVWDDSIVIDSNGDGVLEVLMAQGAYDGSLYHLSLADFSVEHSYNDFGYDNDWQNPVLSAMAIGTAADGSLQAVISADDDKLRLYDISTRQITWTSAAQTDLLRRVSTLPHDSGFSIAAASYRQLTLWTESSDGFVKSYTTDAICDVLTAVSIADEQYVACVRNENWQHSSALMLFDLQLVKQNEVELGNPVTAIQPDGAGNLLLASCDARGLNWCDDEPRLRLVNPLSGHEFWVSRPLLGSINRIRLIEDANGNQRMAVSTFEAMYLSH